MEIQALSNYESVFDVAQLRNSIHAAIRDVMLSGIDPL